MCLRHRHGGPDVNYPVTAGAVTTAGLVTGVVVVPGLVVAPWVTMAGATVTEACDDGGGPFWPVYTAVATFKKSAVMSGEEQ
jgi:hypothetical protein